MSSKSTKTRKRNNKKIKANLDKSFKKNDEETKKQVNDLIGRHTKSSKDLKLRLATFKREIVGNKYSEMTNEDIIEYDQKLENTLKYMFPGTFQKIELSTQIKCALCFQKPHSWENSGPLIGPVQVNLVPMLVPKELQLQKEENGIKDDEKKVFDIELQKYYVGFHEKCILEAENINIVLPEKLEKLGHQLQTFWKYPCKKCKKLGAFVKTKTKVPTYTHLHCTINK
uniref:TFIIS central domain-containing protein n=1 Tax=Strongyloides stercoralis TaxID=6248 RepID=A0A0K0DS29_STRER